LLEAGRVKGAVSNIRNLLSTEAENVDPLTIRLVATALLEQKQPKEALKLLEPALNAHADDAWCWLLAARSHVEMGKFNKAETALMRSLQKDSGLTEAKLLLAWCKLASGETGAAAASAQEVLKHNPNDVAARTILAQARKKRHYQP
jgi:predicted Zn-dependent protease